MKSAVYSKYLHLPGGIQGEIQEVHALLCRCMAVFGNYCHIYHRCNIYFIIPAVIRKFIP